MAMQRMFAHSNGAADGFSAGWHAPLPNLVGSWRKGATNAKALALLAAAVVLTLGFVAAEPGTSTQGSVSAPASISSASAPTMPAPDFFGSMLVAR